MTQFESETLDEVVRLIKEAIEEPEPVIELTKNPVMDNNREQD